MQSRCSLSGFGMSGPRWLMSAWGGPGPRTTKVYLRYATWDFWPMRRSVCAGTAVSVLLLAPLHGSCSDVYEYRFNRGVPAGATSSALWQGVVVEVNQNSVSPRFVTHRRVFFSSWRDFYPSAIKACKLDSDGFESVDDCFTSTARTIVIPEGQTPYQYSYRFQFSMENEGKREDSFLLEKGAHYKVKSD